jgi:hypothetical protein
MNFSLPTHTANLVDLEPLARKRAIEHDLAQLKTPLVAMTCWAIAFCGIAAALAPTMERVYAQSGEPARWYAWPVLIAGHQTYYLGVPTFGGAIMTIIAWNVCMLGVAYAARQVMNPYSAAAGIVARIPLLRRGALHRIGVELLGPIGRAAKKGVSAELGIASMIAAFANMRLHKYTLCASGATSYYDGLMRTGCYREGDLGVLQVLEEHSSIDDYLLKLRADASGSGELQWRWMPVRFLPMMIALFATGYLLQQMIDIVGLLAMLHRHGALH